MQSLVFVLAAATGNLSHESVNEPQRENAWVHQRSRLHLLAKSEDEALGKSRLLWSYEASGFLQHDSAEDPGERTELRVENFLVRTYQDQWNTSFGWQTVTWGETLGPSLIDVINPRDLRDPSYWLQADQKLSIPLLLLGWSRESRMIDIWGSPYAQQSLLPVEWQGVLIENRDRTRTAEFGLRAGERLGGWDMKVYAIRHRARTPAMSLQIQDFEPRILATFPLQTTLGFTVSQAWDSTVLRTELVHAESKEWPEDNQLDFARDQATLGVDGSWGDSFFWGTELRLSQQRSVERRDRDLAWVIVQGQWTLWNERLKALAHLMQRAQKHDAYQRYELTGVVESVWELGLTWEAFQSSNQGYFTRLQAYDRLGLKVSWGF